MYFYTFKYDYAKRKFECVHQCSNLSEYKDFEAKEDPKEFYVSFSFDTEKIPKHSQKSETSSMQGVTSTTARTVER